MAKPGWVPRVLDSPFKIGQNNDDNNDDDDEEWVIARRQNPGGCRESWSKTSGWPRLAKSSPPCYKCYPAKWQNIFRRILSTKLNILKRRQNNLIIVSKKIKKQIHQNQLYLYQEQLAKKSPSLISNKFSHIILYSSPISHYIVLPYLII